MELLKCYILLSLGVLVVLAEVDYSKWKDGDGLSEDDKQLIKKQFTVLSKRGKLPKPEKILRALVSYEGRLVKYLVAYEGGGSVCAGRLSRKFNSQHCKTDAMKSICVDNTPW